MALSVPSSAPSERLRVFIGLDFEATGQYYMSGDDLVFAFGVAVASWDEERERVTVMHVREFVMNLNKPADMSWEQHWENKGFEMRTWHQFWKGLAATLDNLMDYSYPLPVSMRELAAEFAEEKARVEDLCENCHIHWVTDAMLYDPTIANFLLQLKGRPSMMYFDKPGAPDANGCTDRFNCDDPLDLDSFIRGRHPSGASADWKTEIQPIKDLLKQLANTYAPHQHTPGNDAINIVVQMIYANLPGGCNLDLLKGRLATRMAQIATYQ